MTPEGEKLDRFLGEAIAQFNTKHEAPMSAGVRRLTSLTGLLTKEMDARAAELADRLQRARDRSDAALGKFDAYVDSVESAAREAEDAINQLTNGAPPLADSPSSSEG